MANSYFQFKQFTIQQDRCAMKVTTDACLFGAWVAGIMESEQLIINNCLDIGAGTCLLGLMLAQKDLCDTADSIEIDKDAAEQAMENAAASPWKEKVTVIHADAGRFAYQKKYDAIISNPPFYEKELKSDDLRKNIAHHSEGLQLAGLLTIIKENLAPGGSFFLLLPYKRQDEVRKMVTGNEMLIRRLVFVRQSVKHDFFRIMLEGSFLTGSEAATIIDEIAVKDENDNYTPAFSSLLKDYYLNL